MQRVTMELGGHSPAIVFSDADPVAAAKTLVAGKYRNAGQVCIAPSRFYVQRAIEKEFLSAFIQETRKIRIGNGLDPQVTMGPLANRRRLDAMVALVGDAAKSGEVVLGGNRHGKCGFFFEPTVIRNPSLESRLMREEPFGPVAPILVFDDFDAVMADANALSYGLAAYVFSASLQNALAAAEMLQSGMVAVNSLSLTLTETPMGGVKDSGQGYEGGMEGIEGYMHKKYVSLA
jgi:succinate-semialdehyde dehydrogenase/glutarate-semialdehyde dehydrogenase